MITTILTALDLVVSNPYVPLFLSLSILFWSLWAYKIWLARSYRPIEAPFNGTFSILIPTFREDQAGLHETIRSALQQRPLEVIVLVDEREPEVQTLVHQEFGQSVRTTMQGIAKRQTLVAGVKAARGDVIMSVDSDVKLESDTARKLLAAFADPRVGGACGYTRAIVNNNELASLMFFWLTEFRAKVTYRALSTRGQVHVLDGQCYAIRRECWLAAFDRFLNQRFLGVTPVSGDDGWITTLVLDDGWHTLYQENARSFTSPPSSFRRLITQQLRWVRNSFRRSCYVLIKGVAFRVGLPYTLHTIGNTVKSPLIAALLVAYMVGPLLGWQSTHQAGTPESEGVAMSWLGMGLYSGGTAFVVLCVGIMLTKAIRSLPRFQKGRLLVDLALLPVYTAISILVFIPLRIYGSLTSRRINWGTRGDKTPTAGNWLLSTAGTTAGLVLALAFPVALITLMIMLVSPLFAVSVAFAAAPVAVETDY